VAFPHDENPSYLASKAAVPQLTRWFAAKLVASHINVRRAGGRNATP
jgi:NAD(P)-dependent dehydrogenase (short-subunit alcohol dehydrogenase family)